MSSKFAKIATLNITEVMKTFGNATASVPTLPRPKLTPLTEVEKAAAKAILPFVDPLSYGFKDSGGAKEQVSRERLDRHFKALWEKRFLDKRLDSNDLVHALTGRGIAVSMRPGERQLLVRSKWESGRLLSRIDIDEHNGQTDGRAALEMMVDDLPTMFICPSEKGWSGYVWFPVPTWIGEETGEERPACTLAEMNEFVRLIHERIAALVQARGFKATVEVHGAFLERVHDTDSNGVPQSAPRVADGAMGQRTNVKLPRLSTLKDVERFSAAVVKCNPRDLDSPTAHLTNDAGLLRLLADGKAAIESLKPQVDAKAATAQHEKNKLAVMRMSDERIGTALGDGQLDLNNAAQLQRIVDRKPARGPGAAKCKVDRVILIDDLGDKLAVARACIIRARLLLGILTSLDFEANKDRIIELAHELHMENGLSANPRDKDRDTRFINAYKFLLRTFDDTRAGAGNDPNWIDAAHLDEIEQKFISTAAVLPALQTFNASKEAKRYGKASTGLLAAISAIIAKDATVGVDGKPSEGDVPNIAIARMLAHPNFMGVNVHNSVIAACKRIILTCTKALECIAPAIAPGWQVMHGCVIRVVGRAARYAVRKFSWFTFLSAPAQTEHDAPAASPTRGGAVILSLTQYKGDSTPNHISSSIQFDSDEAQLNALYAEYVERDLIPAF